MRIERHDGVCCLTVVTDPIWDQFAFANLVIEALSADDAVIEIDLSFIPALHSPGLANLVAIYVHGNKRGQTVRLSHVTEVNRRVLRATQLDQLFTIVE